MDIMVPAVAAFDATKAEGFAPALAAMAAAAGQTATARSIWWRKSGASRPRRTPRGVPDAGATSRCLIFTTLADAFGRRLA